MVRIQYFDRIMLPLLLLIFVLFIMGIIKGASRISYDSDECKKQQGVYFYTKGNGICLKRDIVIPLRGDTK